MRTDLFARRAAIEGTHWWCRGRQSVVGRVSRHLVSPTPRALILDVGCTTGAMAASLSREYRVIGVDASQRGIEKQTDFTVARPAADAMPIRALAGEGDRIVQAIDADRSTDALQYPADLRRVSLVAVHRRQSGDIRPRQQPGDVPAEHQS